MESDVTAGHSLDELTEIRKTLEFLEKHMEHHGQHLKEIRSGIGGVQWAIIIFGVLILWRVW